MTDDVRAATDRVKKNVFDADGYVGEGAWADLFTHAGLMAFDKLLGDARKVTDAYLAEHPADDGEPVTAEWLKEIGFVGKLSFDKELTLRKVIGPNGVGGQRFIEYDAQGPNYWWYGDSFTDNVPDSTLPDLPTRGRVRRLLTALGAK